MVDTALGTLARAATPALPALAPNEEPVNLER
jgi:hypothetical protein